MGPIDFRGLVWVGVFIGIGAAAVLFGLAKFGMWVFAHLHWH